MTPAQPTDIARYRRWVNAILSRQRLLSNASFGIAGAHSQNIYFGKMGKRPSFNGIHSIISMRSSIQMFGSHAWRVVAFMANIQPHWNFAVSHFISYAMRPSRSATALYGTVIGVLKSISNPNPARFSFQNFLPKLAVLVCSLTRAITELAFVNTAFRNRPSKEPLITVQTDACYVGTSHDLNLANRLGLWSGSFGVQRTVRAFSIIPLFRTKGGGCYA